MYIILMEPQNYCEVDATGIVPILQMKKQMQRVTFLRSPSYYTSKKGS